MIRTNTSESYSRPVAPNEDPGGGQKSTYNRPGERVGGSSVEKSPQMKDTEKNNLKKGAKKA